MLVSQQVSAFSAFIALSNAGIVVSNPATKVTLGDITAIAPILGSLGFFLTIALVHRGVKGAVMIAILASRLLVLLLVTFNTAASCLHHQAFQAPTFMQLDFMLYLKSV